METLHRLLEDRVEELKALGTINAEDVTSLDAMIASVSDNEYSNYITSQIPLEKFSISRTSVNYENVLGLLGNLLSQTEIKKALELNSLSSMVNTISEVENYFNILASGIRSIGKLSEEQLTMINEFEYVDTDELGDFINLKHNVPVLKVLLETDLKTIFNIGPFGEDSLKKAITGTKEIGQHTRYHVNANDNGISVIRKILENQEALLAANINKEAYCYVRLVESLFDESVEVGYNLTLEDLFTIKASSGTLTTVLDKVCDLLNNFRMNLLGGDYIAYRTDIQAGIPLSFKDELFKVMGTKPAKVDMATSNITFKVLR